MEEHEHLPLRRVTREAPCPICGHTDWCSFNEELAVCQRVEEGSRKVARRKDGSPSGWIHVLKERPTNLPPATPIRREIASLESRHLIYREMLRLLRLEPQHLEHLAGPQRGLSPDQIRVQGYRTLPIKRYDVVKAMVDRFGSQLSGIPGFWFDDQEGRWHLAGPAGLLIPNFTMEGKIAAIVIRRDEANEGGKYVWLSSARKGGWSPGVPVHVARPVSRQPRNIVVVTEGPLKANIVAEKYDSWVLGIHGVGNWHEVPSIIEALKPEGVIEACDADWKTNKQVQAHTAELMESLLATNIPVAMAIWPKAMGKGIDDLLLGGHRPNYIRIADVAQIRRIFKVAS